MGKAVSNVVVFPMEGTPIGNWFREATRLCKEVNMTASRVYVKKNVPHQFQDLILRNIRVG